MPKTHFLESKDSKVAHMKVTKKDYQDLVNTIRPLDTADLRETYRTLHAEGKLRANDLDMRYRWDLYHRAWDLGFRLSNRDEYLDAHIDTALRKVVGSLNSGM